MGEQFRVGAESPDQVKAGVTTSASSLGGDAQARVGGDSDTRRAAVGVGTVAATALVLDLPGPRRWLAAADVRLRKLHVRRSRGALASTRPST